MDSTPSRRHLLVGIAMATTVVCFTGCGSDPLGSRLDGGTDSVDQAITQPNGCYGGPNKLYPALTCGSGFAFEPGGAITGANLCNVPPISFEGFSDFTKSTFLNRGLHTAYCGNFDRHGVHAFAFTVQDYLNLRASNPNPSLGDYSITIPVQTNLSQIYWWQNPLINGTISNRPPGVTARFVTEEDIGTAPATQQATFEFVVRPVQNPGTSGRGWIVFEKVCMDACITGLSNSTVLFEIAIQKN